jgi:hypothetical protein
MENVDLVKLTTGGEEMLQFINDNLTYPNPNFEKMDRFLELLESFTLRRNIDMDAVNAINPEDVRETLYSTEDIEAGLGQLNDDDNLIYNLSNMLKEELESYITNLNPERFDGDAHSQNLDVALQNIVAVFNVANPDNNNNAMAGGRKRRSRKSAKKLRKSTKKSRKSAKKSRKSTKKSRKSTKKSRKSTKKSRKH